MHGRTVHLKAKNDVSPYPLHLRAEKRDRVRPCLQRPCRWALHVYGSMEFSIRFPRGIVPRPILHPLHRPEALCLVSCAQRKHGPKPPEERRTQTTIEAIPYRKRTYP